MFDQLKRSLEPPTQKEPAPGMVKNNAGGYGYQVDDLHQLSRFLILGTTGGTFYVGERDLLKQNLEAVHRAVAEQPREVLQQVLKVSHKGIAANNDAAVYVLALLVSQKAQRKVYTKAGDEKILTESSDVALEAMGHIGTVCRTFTHVSHFITYIRKGKLRGWGRGFRRALARAWYHNRSVDDIVHSLIKYQSRDGVSQTDLARLVHPKQSSTSGDPARSALYDHVFYRGDKAKEPEHPRLVAAKRLLQSQDAGEALALMKEHRLPMEAVPTNLRTPDVYRAAVETNGMEWLIRNLGNISKSGLTDPFVDLNFLLSRLSNEDLIQKARLHPLTILKGLHQYRQGSGDRSGSTWTPNPKICAALTETFYKSFRYVEPSGKNILIAVDVSGSMTGTRVSGIPGMTVHEAAAVLAMVAARSEPNYHVMAFDTSSGYARRYGRTNIKTETLGGTYEVPVGPTDHLEQVTQAFGKFGGGGTDCSLPFIYAMEKNLPVDVVVSLTDSETWAGRQHVMESLRELRKRSGRPVKAVNVCMASNHTCTLDLNDRSVMEVVGFDTRIPQLISTFASLED